MCNHPGLGRTAELTASRRCGSVREAGCSSSARGSERSSDEAVDGMAQVLRSADGAVEVHAFIHAQNLSDSDTSHHSAAEQHGNFERLRFIAKLLTDQGRDGSGLLNARTIGDQI
jgi:hypothetical protein